MNANSNRNNVGLGGLPMLFPDANKLNPDYYANEALNRMNPAPPAWVNGDFLKPADLPRGAAASAARRPNIPFPSYFNVNATQDLVGQPDEGQGAPHDQDGLLQHAQLQGGAGDRHRFVRHPELPAGHARAQRVRHVVRIRQRRDRLVQLVHAGVRTTSKATSSTTTAKPTSRTTGR